MPSSAIESRSRPAPAGEMTVVLGPGWPGILLHEAVGHGLEADFNRKGTSNYSGKMGDAVASELCSVVDDPTLLQSRGTLNMNDEGNEPTPQSIAAYREHFGPGYYTFRSHDMAGFVLDGNLLKAPQHVPDEARFIAGG